jgi:tetratricopeptide (TPR) repeat protein
MPSDSDALAGIAWIYWNRSEWVNAIPYFQELLKENPSEDVYRKLARCYAQMDEPGKTVIFLGQAASRYGEEAVANWFSLPDFDIIRETVDFRAFVDQVVGVENRKAIEAIRKREVDDTHPNTEHSVDGFDLPDKPELKVLKPDQ